MARSRSSFVSPFEFYSSQEPSTLSQEAPEKEKKGAKNGKEKKSKPLFSGDPLRIIPKGQFVQDCDIKEWVRDKKILGAGSYGEISAICRAPEARIAVGRRKGELIQQDVKNCSYIQKEGSYMEGIITLFAAILGISPPIYEIRQCHRKSAKNPHLDVELWWIQKRIFGLTLGRWVELVRKNFYSGKQSKEEVKKQLRMILAQYKDVANKLLKNNLFHNDMHLDNWMLDISKTARDTPPVGPKLVLIDWGMATIGLEQAMDGALITIPKLLHKNDRFVALNFQANKKLIRETFIYNRERRFSKLLRIWSEVCWLVTLPDGVDEDHATEGQHQKLEQLRQRYDEALDREDGEDYLKVSPNRVGKFWREIARITREFLESNLHEPSGKE